MPIGYVLATAPRSPMSCASKVRVTLKGLGRLNLVAASVRTG